MPNTNAGDLPKTDSCTASERAYCASQCGGAHNVDGCYVTQRWRIKAAPGGNLIRVPERTVNCNCHDDCK
jgi:hypothetical protein